MDSLILINDIVANTTGSSLADGIRNFIGPILMLVVGIIAITFLVRREMTQFILFLVIAIVVFILFFAPNVLKNIAQGVESSTKTGGQWK